MTVPLADLRFRYNETVNVHIPKLNDLVGYVQAATAVTTDPTILALMALDATPGILVETAADVFTKRTLTGTTNRITISNGDGVAGNPTLDISGSYVGQASITTLGTIGTGIWQGSIVAAEYGGTGFSSYAVGDILYASGPTTLSKLADVATGSALISGGVGVAPAWGKVDLTAHVVGDLPLSNLAQGTARSVLGVTGNVTADYAPIQGTANQFLGINSAGTVLAFQTMGGDATLSGGTLTVANDVITYAKMQNVSATDRVLGRSTAGAGDPEEIPFTASARAISALNVVQGDLLYGTGTGTAALLPKNTTATRYLSNTGTSNNPAWAQINLSNGVSGNLPFTNLVNASAASIVGATAAGAFAELTAVQARGVLVLSTTDNVTFNTVTANEVATGGGSTVTFKGTSGGAAVTTGLRLLDTDDSHALRVQCGSNLTANRRLTLTTGDANRTLDISAADVTIGSAAATFLGTPSSANLAALVTDETGSGALVFAASPTITGTLTVDGVRQIGTTAFCVENSFGALPTGRTGAGLEMGLTSSTNAIIQAYNRTSATYVGLSLTSANVIIRPNASTIATFDTTGLTLAGSWIGQADDVYFGLDGSGTTPRVGWTKKAGALAKLTFGSASSLSIAQSSATNILASGTFTDIATFSGSGLTVTALTVSGQITVSGNILLNAANLTIYAASGDVFARAGTGGSLRLGANGTNSLAVLSSASLTVSMPSMYQGTVRADSNDGSYSSFGWYVSGTFKWGNYVHPAATDGLYWANASSVDRMLLTQAGNLTLLTAGSYIRTQATTVSGLPSATVGAGSRAFVTDATATTFASVVAGGGANGVPVYSDGTNWRIG